MTKKEALNIALDALAVSIGETSLILGELEENGDPYGTVEDTRADLKQKAAALLALETELEKAC